MPDNKQKKGGQDRSRVAAGEGYEVRYFARKHGITVEQARQVIERVGNDREKLNAAAAKRPSRWQAFARGWMVESSCRRRSLSDEGAQGGGRRHRF